MTIAQDGPDYFLPEYVRAEITRDTGFCHTGVCYVKLHNDYKWRKARNIDLTELAANHYWNTKGKPK